MSELLNGLFGLIKFAAFWYFFTMVLTADCDRHKNYTTRRNIDQTVIPSRYPKNQPDTVYITVPKPQYQTASTTPIDAIFPLFIVGVIFVGVYLLISRTSEAEAPEFEGDEKDHVRYATDYEIPVKDYEEEENGTHYFSTEIITDKTEKQLKDGRTTDLTKADKKYVYLKLSQYNKGLNPDNVKWNVVRTIKSYWAKGKSRSAIYDMIKDNRESYSESYVVRICQGFEMALKEHQTGETQTVTKRPKSNWNTIFKYVKQNLP